MKRPNETQKKAPEDTLAASIRNHRDRTERAIADIWGKGPPAPGGSADYTDLESRMRAFDASIQRSVDEHRRWTEQAIRDIWGSTPSVSPAGSATTVRRPSPPGRTTANYLIDLVGQPSLEMIDGIFRRDFGLDRYFPSTCLAYPTIYCESLEEFFTPFAEILDISDSARQAYIAQQVEEAKEAACHGSGILGVNWPGRGCYINGWLFAYGRAASAADALKDPQIFPSILRTVAHEKLGHGFISAYTDAGQEKQRLDLSRFDLAQRFGQRLTDSPRYALLAHKHGLLWYTSRYLEEGWATWIEHYVRSRVCFASQEGAGNPPCPSEPYTLIQVWHAIREAGRSAASPEISEAVSALAWALDVLFCNPSPDAADVHRATSVLQRVEDTLAEPVGRILGQPLSYVVGYLAMRKIESQQGTYCVPYAVAIAGGVTFDIQNISASDLERVVQSDPRMNLDTRLFLVSRLRLESPDSVSELAHRAREQLSLAVPEPLL